MIIFYWYLRNFSKDNTIMEHLGYALLAIVALAWITVVITGLVMAMPWGLIGLAGILGLGLLLIKVLSDRLKNKEDDHYSDNVDI